MRAPSTEVLGAWGCTVARPLAGGRGEAFRAERLVLKPVGQADRYERLSAVLVEAPRARTVRIGLPVRSTDGRWIVDGWGATEWLDGDDRALECGELLDISARFHRAVADVPAGSVLDGFDRWAEADRFAWGRSGVHAPPELARLLARRRAVDAPAQLIHGDLAGNVVSDDVLGRGVIDISPYWRPTSYADAIVIADSLAYGGSGQAELEDHLRDAGDQFLIRAVLFRVGASPAELPAYQPLIDRLLA